MVDYWIREAQRWLEDAEEDLKVAEDLIKLNHFAASCFHSQQSAEKAVKAALYAYGVEARGHSIRELLKKLEDVSNTDVSKLVDDARLLDKHYAPPRYPNLHPGISAPAYSLYGRGDAETCLKAAKNVLNFVKNLLKL